MDLGLEGRTALVMAGTRGIGFSAAEGLVAEGANVVLCGRSTASIAEAARLLPNAHCLKADVTSAKDMSRIVSVAEKEFGGIDILVINAGGPPAALNDALGDEDWARAVDLTLMSAVRTANLVLPGMRRRGWGRIVIISSFGVKQPVLGLTLSNSIRMAVLGWAKTVARQVALDGVLVNSVCPGWTRTERLKNLVRDPDSEAKLASSIPLGRIGEAREVARLVIFLASEAASYMTGTAIAVDGGLVEGYS